MLAAQPAVTSGAAVLHLDADPGQLFFAGGKVADPTSDVCLSLAGGQILNADLRAAGVKPYYNYRLLASYKQTLVGQLAEHGYALRATSAESNNYRYTYVDLLAEPEHVFASVVISAVGGLVEEAFSGQGPCGQPEDGRPFKVAFLKTER